MKKEKLIHSFIAVLFGLLVAGIIFYLFQATRTVSDVNNPNAKNISLASPTPTPLPSTFLTVDKPKDEEVVTDKVLVVSGKAPSSSVIVVLSESSEDVISPSENGKFSTTVNLNEGQNILEITSIALNGESITIKKTVTYSQEEF